jgi:subtilase family serine protease
MTNPRGRLVHLAAAAVITGGAAVALIPSASAGASGHARGSAPVCGAVSAGFARCNARYVTLDGHPAPAAASPSGDNPADLQAAYALPSATNGAGQTVAIVDAYDDPNAVADVSVYRSTLLGSGYACAGNTSVAGCTFGNGASISKVGQTGTARYPRANGGWAQEISLDVDMVSAVCPRCNILLVEASSNSYTNLFAAEDYATSHANYVSNSWSGGESSSETSSSFDGHFNKPGKVITASTGDNGYGVGYPAASQYVVAVGGTTLHRTVTSTGTTYSETAWSGAGSGCSAYEPQPSWQRSVANITGSCARRALADVSADADPSTGVSVYDTYAYQGMSGWLVFGGTSVSSPVIASVFALSGNTSTASSIYAAIGTSALHDPTSGSNGSCGSDLCAAATGWDGPTGSGSPAGVTAF